MKAILQKAATLVTQAQGSIQSALDEKSESWQEEHGEFVQNAIDALDMALEAINEAIE